MNFVIPESQPVETPCVGVCTLDQKGLCIGCGRSTEEITRWASYSQDERRGIMQRLARSRAQG
ncbi:MAG: DUF1289 domain-containing protein [Xanthomonadales bacterium]|nr:DUF1289 domain-containing protein [Xanthomonadales bacterium]